MINNLFVNLPVKDLEKSEAFFEAIVDARRSAEVLISPGVESRQDVDSTVDAAVKAGGKETRPPADHGFMQQRVFREAIYRHPNHVQPH